MSAEVLLETYGPYHPDLMHGPQTPAKPTFADSGRLTSARSLGAARHLAIDRHSAVIRKQLDWVVEAPHRIFADAFEIEIAFDEVGERAGQQHRSPQLFGEGFETRRHVDRRSDDGEVEPGARPDIAVHDVSDVDADAVIQRRTTGFAVLFVQGNHGLTGFGHGMQQICAGLRLAERKNGEQTVADEFQYFPAMSRNRLRHRVEIAVQEINDVIARPVVGDPGEITQIADHDGGAYRRPASAPGGAGQNELAGMRPDIGFEQRSRQPVLDTDFADQRQNRQQFQQAGDMRVVETSAPVGCKGHDMPLAERMVQRPCHIVGQASRPHFVIDGVLAAKRGIAFEILAHLGGTVMDFVGGTIDVFGSLPDVVVASRKLCLAHPVGPHDPGAKPLRMMDQDMKRRPLDGNARSLEPDTQLSENIVYEALIARVVCQPVHNVAIRMRDDGIDVWRRVHSLLLRSNLDRRYGICHVPARRRQWSPPQSACAHGLATLFLDYRTNVASYT